MNGYGAFLKKELTENMKNYRFPILFAVFLIFGLTSPFLAKFMPDILSAMAPDMQMGSAPVALDAWEQFYKNISGAVSVSELFVPAMISVAITVVGLWSSILLFDRKQL